MLAPQHDEGPTHVLHELTPAGEMTMLRVAHSGFQLRSEVRIGISNGWPTILFSLKTTLETGETPIHPGWRSKK